MRRLFWLLVLCALAVGISLAARFNEGYLLLVLPPYRAEISLNLAIVLLVLTFALLYGLLRAAVLTVSLPNRVQLFRERRRAEKAAVAFQDAMRLLFEGRFSQALKKAGEAHAANHSPGLAALLAARAAQHLGEAEKEKVWLERASRDDPRMEPARLMLEAEMHLGSRNFEEAATTLQRLQTLSGRHIAALRLELRAQQGCANWPEVLRLVRLLEKRDGVAPELAQEIELKAHQENVRQLKGDAGQLLDYLRQLPARENSPRLAIPLAEGLIEHGAHDQAQRLIEGQLGVQWNSALISLYGRLRGPGLISCIAQAEAWLVEHPADPGLLLTLGRLCLAQCLWGKAQSYLEASLSLAEQREARLELARLLEQTERSSEALPHYRAAAEQPA